MDLMRQTCQEAAQAPGEVPIQVQPVPIRARPWRMLARLEELNRGFDGSLRT